MNYINLLKKNYPFLLVLVFCFGTLESFLSYHFDHKEDLLVRVIGNYIVSFLAMFLTLGLYLLSTKFGSSDKSSSELYENLYKNWIFWVITIFAQGIFERIVLVVIWTVIYFSYLS